MNRNFLRVVLAAVAICGSHAHAEDDVFISWPTGVADIDNDKAFVNGAWNITTTLTLTSGGGGQVFYKPASAGDPIRYIRITANQAGGGSAVPDCNFTVMSNNPQGFQVPFIWELNHVSGNANSRMSISETDDVGGGGANIVCGDIVDVINISGDLLADVESTSNLIDRLIIQGDIGELGTPVTISSAGKIERIVADAIHADISTPLTSGNFVQSIQTTVADFTGSLTTRNLTCDDCNNGDPKGISIAGALAADLSFSVGVFEPITATGVISGDMTITENLNDPITAASLTGNIIIGDTLNDDITLGSGGLDGFISIDADDDGTGSWDGDVIVGSYTLGTAQTGADKAPEYKRTIAQLGGGAIGIVADWGFHPTDTYPADGVVIGQPQFTSTSTVRIFHYGPLDGTLHDSLKIEMKDINDPDEPQYWTDVTSDFDFSFDSGSPRELKIDPKNGEAWIEDSDYRVTHDEGDLQIADDVLVGTTDVDVDAYVYDFCFVDN